MGFEYSFSLIFLLIFFQVTVIPGPPEQVHLYLCNVPIKSIDPQVNLEVCVYMYPCEIKVFAAFFWNECYFSPMFCNICFFFFYFFFFYFLIFKFCSYIAMPNLVLTNPLSITSNCTSFSSPLFHIVRMLLKCFHLILSTLCNSSETKCEIEQCL